MRGLHDGAVGDPPEFSVAGTVFQSATTTTAAPSVTVSLVDANGATYTAKTNSAGNFYVTPKNYAPKYPMKVSLVSSGATIAMASHVGWAGGCAVCHVDPAGPDSPGHVYVDVTPGAVP